MEQNFLLKTHFALAFYMTGIIFLIQVIHYPLFAQVGVVNFPAYHAEHVRRTTSIIAIPMLVELFTLFALFYIVPSYRTSSLFISNAILLIITWGVTFFISVPQHNILSQGFDTNAWSTLVNTNWIRTFAWLLRGLIIFKLL